MSEPHSSNVVLREPSLDHPAVDDISRSFALSTRLDALFAWGQKNSLWPLPYGTACCGIELMSVMGPRYDLARFGAEVVRFSPRQSDCYWWREPSLKKWLQFWSHIYEQMLEPKFVLSIGGLC